MGKRKGYNEFLEKIRIMKVNIFFKLKEHNKSIIAVTSGEKGVGKTMLSIELAKSIADDNEKVLLLELDLRTPKLKEMLNLNPKYGFTDVLLGTSSLDEACLKINKNLSVLTAGAVVENPLILIKDDGLERIFNIMKDKYKFVIIDTNLIGEYAETQLIISKVDGIVLIAVPEKTKKTKLISCKKIIDSVNGYLIGVIFNNIKSKKLEYQF